MSFFRYFRPESGKARIRSLEISPNTTLSRTEANSYVLRDDTTGAEVRILHENLSVLASACAVMETEYAEEARPRVTSIETRHERIAFPRPKEPSHRQ